MNMTKKFKEKESVGILKILCLIDNLEEYQKNMQSCLKET